MTVEAYPLQWPTGRPRTAVYKREAASFECTLGRARDDLIAEVQRLCGKYARPNTVISSNLALRQDGLPLANQPRVLKEDPGVAVYFTRKDRQMSFACDRWLRVEHNMRAIAKTIEALRGIERWGTGDMVEAAFTGFTALPAPTPAAPEAWWSTLGVQRDASPATILGAFRFLRSRYHPDKQDTGNAAKFDAVLKAYDRAVTEGRA